MEDRICCDLNNIKGIKKYLQLINNKEYKKIGVGYNFVVFKKV